MTLGIKLTSVMVDDQDKALAFYTDLRQALAWRAGHMAKSSIRPRT